MPINMKNPADTYFRLLVRPYDPDPIQIHVRMDYIVTGDINLYGMTVRQCEEVELILDFVRNQVADHHLELLKVIGERAAEKKKDKLP